MINSMSILKKIQYYKKEKGWSDYELAKRAGMSSNILHNWEIRKSVPSLNTLDALCDALGINIVSLFLDDTELTALTKEQREIINLWNTLSSEQKRNVISLIKSMNRHFD